ncbi:ABC transporter ATP-binding protein [Candidatus Dependentiae bacterium]|nr:ABC transporter ATP-binding protein [Candidatus Dependentiae bacterium]
MKTENKIIIADNLTKKFGGFTAVDKISFEVYKGEVFGFLGANGAGKTTAMKMLCGLLEPTSGEAEIAGFDAYKDRQKIKMNIGYMSQKFSLYQDLTILENIYFYAGIYGISKTETKDKSYELLKKFRLEAVKDKLIKTLPPGWRQKLAFSIAGLHNPKIIFLDEPTGGVDPVTRRSFWELIYETVDCGITVFVTTHYMDEAEYCDRVSIMVNGKIEALNSPKLLKEKYESETMYDVFLKLARYSVSK